MKTDRDIPAIRLTLTPMVDLTFLLLVFFMLLPFRSLERQVSAYLPRTRPWHGPILPVDGPTIRVELQRSRGEWSTRVRLLDTYLGSGEKAFRRLDARIAAILAHQEELPGLLDAAGDVPHQDVIRCVDSFRKAGVKFLEFTGAPPPGRDS